LSSVQEVMTREVVTIESSKTILDAATIMTEKKVGGLVVVRDGDIVGIITERDILRRVVARRYDPEQVRIREVMSTPVISVTPDGPVSDAAKKMIENRIRRLPVIEGPKLVGIITSTDLARHLGEKKKVLDCVISLKATRKVEEDQASCYLYKPDPYLTAIHLRRVCGACFWYLYGRCTREISRLIKHL